MNINKVTITGADDKVNIDRLYRTWNQYPFVEWGILFSGKNSGTYRYPSKDWRKQIEQRQMPLSAHFCGQYAKDVIEHQIFSAIDDLHPSYKRIQLNYTFRNELANLPAVLDFARTCKRSIILQFNRANMEAIDEIRKAGLPPNIEILHDASGGTGKEITFIPAPFWSVYTGYAGGICPETIRFVCKEITETNIPDNVWIDMESGVRTRDRFDFEKVEDVLQRIDADVYGRGVKTKKILKMNTAL